MEKTPTTGCNWQRGYRSSPHWKSVSALATNSMSLQQRRWLRYPRSLTAALRAACCGELRVEVLRQGADRAFLDEARALGMAPGARPLVRQVVLCCNGVPWIFARTIVPYRSQGGSTDHLLRLGNRPLGALLFADPSIRRERIESAQLRRGHALHAAADGGGGGLGALWGRRCIHHLSSGPLLVTEVFLPSLLDGGHLPPVIHGTS